MRPPSSWVGFVLSHRDLFGFVLYPFRGVEQCGQVWQFGCCRRVSVGRSATITPSARGAHRLFRDPFADLVRDLRLGLGGRF